MICFQFRKRAAFVSIRYRNHMRARQQISIKIRTRTEQALLKAPKTQSLSLARKCKMIRFNTKTLQNTHTQSDPHTYTRAKRITLQTSRMFGCCYCWRGKCVWKIDYRSLMEKLQAAKTQQTNKKKKQKELLFVSPQKISLAWPKAVRTYNTVIYNTPSTRTELRPKSEKLN